MAAIQRLIGSVRRRCQAVIASRGSHTVLTVVVAGNLTVWDIFVAWSNILKPPFLEVMGKRETSIFGGLLL